MSYQDRYWIMTVCTHGDFTVMPEIRLPSTWPNIPFSPIIWAWANESLPYPINGKHQARKWQVSSFEVVCLTRSGIKLLTSHTGSLHSTDSTTASSPPTPHIISDYGSYHTPWIRTQILYRDECNFCYGLLAAKVTTVMRAIMWGKYEDFKQKSINRKSYTMGY